MKKRILTISTAPHLFRITVCCIILVFLLSLVPEVQAHPHVFITQRLNLVFDDKGLAGIKVCWQMDDMFAAMIAEDHDLNQNGKLEISEIQAVKEKAFSFVSEYNYFTFIKIDNEPFQVKFIKDFNAILENRKLVYEFLVPCHVTATNLVKKLTVASYDPSYYISIYFAPQKPVSFTAAEDFDVNTFIKEDPDTTIYFDMIHPWTFFMEFRRKL
jgi:ABC-type uncharacterized transport system substrate-binding protein